ncbi:MAG: nitrogenase component 1 [Planctomycetota bacterium]
MSHLITRPSGAVSTTNACKLCAPLGACLAFKGVERAVPFIHGSQGCSTYIRRYLIGHFREPMDISCSNFSEEAAVFGGAEAFCSGLANVNAQYRPSLIGIATTCLAETIGEDLPLLLARAREQLGPDAPPLIAVSSPSYAGTHADGFHRAVRRLVEGLAVPGARTSHVNLFPGMFSPADLRWLSDLLAAFALPGCVLPDYSDTLDGPTWDRYHDLPPGGTPISDIAATGSAAASVGLALAPAANDDAGTYLAERFAVPYHRLGAPVGIAATDALLDTLSTIAERPVPDRLRAQRGRLIDSYVDAHKFCNGRRAVLYGDEDHVVALARFLAEIGIRPVVCASGAASGLLRTALADLDLATVTIMDDSDFSEIETAARAQNAELVIGHSKGYALARALEIPLVRVGLPVSDRIGGARIRNLGYDGTQALFDRIVNAIIEREQATNPVGYMTY